MRGCPPSVTETVAVSPSTVAVEVLVTVAAQPAVGAGADLVLEGRGGRGHLEGRGGRGGLTVVVPRAATPVGGLQVRDSPVGVPWTTKVTSASMAPGTK